MIYEVIEEYNEYKIGDQVFDYLNYDNGMSLTYTLEKNEVYIPVTFNKNGDGDFSAVPVRILRKKQDYTSIKGTPSNILANILLALLSGQSLTNQQWNHLESLYLQKDFREKIKEIRARSDLS